MPVGAARRIRVARLQGTSETGIRHGALLLEDALRTASLPGTERGRLVLVRFLDLGEIYVDRSATVVAYQLERQLAELIRHAVHGDDPNAFLAQVVFFHDRLDAFLSLIAQLSRGTAGERERAWYWRSAVPGWQPDMTVQQAGRVLLRYLFTFDTDIQVLAQAFQRLVDTSSLDVILCAIQEEDGRGLLQRFGWVGSEHAVEPTTVQLTESRVITLPCKWHVVLTQWVTRWGLLDVRSLWLVAWAVQSWHPERTVTQEETTKLLQVIGLAINTPLALSSREDPSMRQRSVETGGAVQNWHPERTVTQEETTKLLQVIGQASSNSLRSPRAEAHSTVHVSVENGSVIQADQTKDQQEPSRWIGEALYTPHTGFWFVISLLVRTGFGRAVQTHPNWIDDQVTWRVLCSLADRLLIHPDDPVRAWLSESAGADLKHFDDKPQAMTSDDVTALVKTWRISIRRWCRLQAGLGLWNLVRRPGWVAWDKTYVEVSMPLSAVDLRIRRAGLDIDPGWVPWLGCVVHFHYDDGRKWHEAS